MEQMIERQKRIECLRGGDDCETSPSAFRISVAMATYNGEKFIEEQLVSICRQTRKPDEIVISDDGSVDATLEIVNRVAQSPDAQGIDFLVITDNPRHGYCGNFEWAIKKTTGDLIFLSDQDDVWLPEKVERVSSVFSKHPGALCVMHNASIIDEKNNPIQGDFHSLIKLDKLPTDKERVVHLSKDEFLERSASATLANGMVMCISRGLLATALPFPESRGLHDCWIGFCALCRDQCWYLSESLAQYRLHGNNTCGNSAKKSRLATRIDRIKRKVTSHQSAVCERYYLGKAMVAHIESLELTEHPAYGTAVRVYQIGRVQIDAFRSGGIVGAVKLCRLFCCDMRYRRSGMADFLYQLVAVTFRNKSELPQEGK